MLKFNSCDSESLNSAQLQRLSVPSLRENPSEKLFHKHRKANLPPRLMLMNWMENQRNEQFFRWHIFSFSVRLVLLVPFAFFFSPVDKHKKLLFYFSVIQSDYHCYCSGFFSMEIAVTEEKRHNGLRREIAENDFQRREHWNKKTTKGKLWHAKAWAKASPRRHCFGSFVNVRV